jgi:ATP-binding cassette, subfamily B (MDR/TAP), member 1
LDFVYIGLGVLTSVYIANVCWIVSGERISRRIRSYNFPLFIHIDRRKYLQAVLRQNIAFFDRLGAGEVTNRISHDVDLIQDGISDKVCYRNRHY